MGTFWRWCCLLLLGWTLQGFAASQGGLAPVPPLNSPVTDLAGVLSPGQAARLEAELNAFEQRKGSQIAVLIVPSTRPEAIEQYAIRVAEQWRLGRKKIDDGAILVVAKDDRTLRIEVGYGLEGALNDATAKRIIEEIIVPRFKRGDFDGGIAAGIDSIMKIADGEPLPPVEQSGLAGDGGSLRQALPLVIIAAVALGALLRAIFGRLAGAAITASLAGVAAWLLAGSIAITLAAAALGFVLTLLGASRIAGLYIGGSGGRRGGWGGGGGGFGGGGASGKW